MASSLLTFYLLYLFAVTTVLGCSAVGAGSGLGLDGNYYSDLTSSSLANQRVDPTVDFDFGYTSPVWWMPQQNFTIRWLGGVQPLYTETYTFYVDSDDGARLYVNGQVLIDHWAPQVETTWSGSITLQAGRIYTIRLDYRQDSWSALVHLSWSSACQSRQIIPQHQLYTQAQVTALACSAVPTGTGTGLQGQYFSDMNFQNAGIKRVDPTVNFDWGTGSADASLPSDFFSAVWTGLVQPRYSGTYTFYVSSDDGAKLRVGGQNVVDRLGPQGVTEYSGTISLTAGQPYVLQLWYQDYSWTASVVLSWSSDCQPKQVIPKAQLYPGYGLTGNYYTDRSFSNLHHSQLDASIQFNWGAGSPSGLPSNGFSIKWTGYIMPTCSGSYTFYTTSDDGSNILVNGASVINSYFDKGATEVAGTPISLTAYQVYSFEVDYYENNGDASISVSWSSACQAKSPITSDHLFPASISSSLMHGYCYGGYTDSDQGIAVQNAWLGVRAPLSMMYSTMCGGWIFSQVYDTWNAGNVPMLSYQPDHLTSDNCADVDGNTMVRINTGAEDANVQSFFRDTKVFLSGPNGIYGDSDDRRIYFRFAHEMNGNWYKWSGNPTAVWNLANQAGIDKTRMQWVWCPNGNDAYVDWLGIDGYNSADTWWPSPAQVFDDMITRLRAIAPSKPLGIPEVGCATTGHSVALKSQWITDFFAYCQQHNVKFAMWFDIESIYPDYATFDSRAGSDTYYSPITNRQYNVYNAYRTAVVNTGVALTPGNPRVISDAQFMGRF